jgi:hypothetical protein
MNNKDNDDKKIILNNIENKNNNLLIFTIKSIIIFILIASSIGSMIPRVRETERNKLIFLSFIQNPYVLWKISLIEEGNGDMIKAKLYIDAAIGLLEMNGASDKIINRYQERINYLNSKINK